MANIKRNDMETVEPSARQVPCSECPLRQRPVFRDFTAPELDYVWKFKRGELRIERGASILVEGSHNPHFYTVLSGWAFRYKLIEDGRRQIVNYEMPGDLIGLQGSIMGEMNHSVEALSPVVLCVFERDRLMELFQAHPTLGYDLTWISAREEYMLDENLLTVGRRSALERIAYLVVFLARRAHDAGLNGTRRVELPITQQHIADTLGLSLVHTNKTIRKLINSQLIAWRDGGCIVNDLAGLEKIARWRDTEPKPRPFL